MRAGIFVGPSSSSPRRSTEDAGAYLLRTHQADFVIICEFVKLEAFRYLLIEKYNRNVGKVIRRRDLGRPSLCCRCVLLAHELDTEDLTIRLPEDHVTASRV